jgi:hypothetical protein
VHVRLTEVDGVDQVVIVENLNGKKGRRIVPAEG